MSTVTFGNASAPSQIITNLDALFSQSLAAYRKTLYDNIGAANPWLHEMISRELYEGQDGGTDIRTPLLYALSPMDWYSGNDELSVAATDGVTESVYTWAQAATPISYSMKEVKQNKQRILNLVETKMKQAEMGIQEGFAQAFMWGAATTGGTLYTPQTSPVNGATGIDPLFKLIDFVPSANRSVGNINQSTSTWWQNKTYTSSAATTSAFALEVDHVFNLCCLGTGGKPKLILMDQVTDELYIQALRSLYRFTELQVDQAYPFENFVYRGAHWVMDDKVPDVYSGVIPNLLAGSGDPTSLTYGSAVYINPEFFRLVYEEESDFVMLKDENGKTFQKPIAGDSRVGHMAWMGNTTVQNRRKNGVHGKIARTLTVA